jgi:hypothetical protein
MIKRNSKNRKLYGEVEEHPKDKENESFGSSSDLSDESTITQNIVEINDGLDDIEVKDAEELKTKDEFISTLDKIRKTDIVRNLI